ncbi:MAG: hypothetical protein JXR94_23050 [Candidatus Hydrogenedentes bacterium]|nr:hypothetical protein [Candidatus Hydrogenedentota bacterium]
MPVKYECPKCGRRFTEWGAEKVGFKCPGGEWSNHGADEEIELTRVGGGDERPAKRPTLKRHVTRVKAVEVEPGFEKDEVADLDAEGGLEEEDDEFVADTADDEVSEEADEDAVPLVADEEEAKVDDGEDLSFGEVSPSLGDGEAEQAVDDWEQ